MDPRTRILLFLLAGAVVLAAAGFFLGGYRRIGPFVLSAGGAVLILLGILYALATKGERRRAHAAEAARVDARVAELGPVQPPLVVPKDQEGAGPFQACMQCGSLKLHPTFLAGALFPDAYRCERCGHKGPALTLDTAADYQRYLEGLREDHEERRT
ncbi:MAG TPA: hypothetical protein VNZ52_05285 [Candidatus Thermoplasmatota archaeon]|nr:hypothetical protein [Candidatus Thermoplasmatota archaeon]